MVWGQRGGGGFRAGSGSVFLDGEDCAGGGIGEFRVVAVEVWAEAGQVAGGSDFAEGGQEETGSLRVGIGGGGFGAGGRFGLA